MGQGSTPSGGESQGGGGMGLGLLGSLFGGMGGGGGSQGVGASGADQSTQLIQPAGSGAPGGPGLMGQLAQILQDPEVLKALGETTKHLGNAIASGNKIPGQAAALLQQAVGGQTPQVSQTAGSGPFVGDIPNFTPQQAQTILQALGIPGGFTPIGRG